MVDDFKTWFAWMPVHARDGRNAIVANLVAEILTDGNDFFRSDEDRQFAAVKLAAKDRRAIKGFEGGCERLFLKFGGEHALFRQLCRGPVEHALLIDIEESGED